jgi:outer membrane protein OmpA-like peptidoglycan-associated protein
MHKTAVIACLFGATALTACTTTDPYTGQTVRSNTRTGALVGAALGAGLGYLSNDKSEQGRKNALLGAGVGALAGAGVGAYMDQQLADLRRPLADTGVTVTRQGDNIVLNMPSDVTFAFDRSDVQPQFVPVLNEVANTLNPYPSTLIDVVGHADAVGSDAYNQALSERRASSVASYLVSRNVMPARLYVPGQGERQPIASNDTETGRAQNRRVEILPRPSPGRAVT